MAKSFASINKPISNFIGSHNELVNKVGNITNLATTEDSDLVGAVNSLLSQSGVDSSAIQSILDSGEYLSFPTLTANTDSDFVLTSTDQTIGGTKTFANRIFPNGSITIANSNPELELTHIDDAFDSAKSFVIKHDGGGTTFRWQDSAALVGTNVYSIAVDSNAGYVTNHNFYIGNNVKVATLDSWSVFSDLSLVTKQRGDSRYLLDSAGSVTSTHIGANQVGTSELISLNVTESILANTSVSTNKLQDSAVTTAKLDADAVTRAKLADEVALIIYDSDGVAVKTLYGAGS